MKTPGLLVGSILLTACSVESVEPVDEPSYPSLEPTSRLSAPMQPREEMALPAYAPHDSAVTTTSDTPELDVRWPHLHLARGEGYPESMMLTLPEQIHAPCEDGVYEVATTNVFATVATDGDGVEVELSQEPALRLHVSDAANAEVTVTGTGILTAAACGLPEGTAIELTLRQAVTVHPVRGRVLARCPLMAGESPSTDEPLGPEQPVLLATRVQAGAHLEAVLVDEEGAIYEAANAQPDAQLAVEIEGDLDAPPDPLAKLSDWFAPARPGPITLTPFEGPAREVLVISGDRLLAIPVAFNLAGPKVVAIAPLVEGATYPEGVWSAAHNVIAPVAVGAASTLDGPLCSAPSPEWVEVTTTTPDVCATIPLMPPLAGQPADPLVVAGGPTLGAGATMLRGGLCEVVVSAPDVPWSTSIRVALPDPPQ